MNHAKKPYHHGDLEQTLLATARHILSEDGVDGLSMRKLADRVGVSRTAPYHHFKDKNALLCQIAIEGFEHQKQLMSQIETEQSTLSDRDLFEHYMLSYIRFAEQNPETYDLMYGRAIWKSGTPTEPLKEISKESFHQWLKWVEVLQQKKVLPDCGSPLRVGQTTWGTLHGLCRLLIDGVYVNRDDLEDMARHAVRVLTREN